MISVPRSCVKEFFAKYLNLVETFYYVTLSENKSSVATEKTDYVIFNVNFNLNPADGSFNPRELINRIQVRIYFIIIIFETKKVVRNKNLIRHPRLF